MCGSPGKYIPHIYVVAPARTWRSVYVYICKYIFSFIHIYIHIYMYICVYKYIYIWIILWVYLTCSSVVAQTSMMWRAVYYI